jgi:hypothetical protein
MTRVFLAAGVAALAIAAPASAGPHKDRQAEAQLNGAERPQARAQRSDQRAQRTEQRAQRAPRMERQQQIASMQRERPQRAERQQQRVERQQAPQRVERQARVERRQAQPQRVERQARVERHQAPQRVERQTRVAERQQARPQRVERQTRVADRQQVQQQRVERAQMAERRQVQMNRVDNRMANNQQLRADRQARQQDLMAQRQEIRGDRQMATRNLLAERHALRADRIANAEVFRTSPIARTLALTPRTHFIAPAQAVRFVGQPISTVDNFVTLSALPASVSYLYPATPNYYYQYGDGYLYQVDRGSSIINALIPLLAGGFLPGTYLPQSYMSSYVPSYYGLNSFYPANYNYGYGGYNYASHGGYGYPNLCNRYAYGVVYQVDCVTGMVVNVIPTYAGGYGVGQMLPSAYSSYNVPMQYRSMYYPTADYSYWYAPGAIYQYDTSSSLITSVAALMTPGFTVGQPLPVGYGTYNVPYAYRSTYYDTPNAWYRYNNGNIYQVDPATMLVTATVASLLS